MQAGATCGCSWAPAFRGGDGDGSTSEPALGVGSLPRRGRARRDAPPAESPCASPSTWRLSSPRATTPSSPPSTNACGRPESQPKWRSSLACANCSRPSTPSSGTAVHGNALDTKDSRSALQGGEGFTMMSRRTREGQPGRPLCGRPRRVRSRSDRTGCPSVAAAAIAQQSRKPIAHAAMPAVPGDEAGAEPQSFAAMPRRALSRSRERLSTAFDRRGSGMARAREMAPTISASAEPARSSASSRPRAEISPAIAPERRARGRGQNARVPRGRGGGGRPRARAGDSRYPGRPGALGTDRSRRSSAGLRRAACLP